MLSANGRMAPVQRGFTLIEVIVTLSVFAILVALAVPSMSRWVANNKVRATADALQNALRMAQAESLRRSRQVVFSLTTDGSNWQINTISAATGDPQVSIESGNLSGLNAGVTITGPAAICFNSLGRLVANTGAGCTLPGAVQQYFVQAPTTSSDRPLRVDVSLGGQVHMCDRAKTLSDANPDGCAP